MTQPTPLGVDLEALTNIPKLNLSFPTTPDGILEAIPESSNTLVPLMTFLILTTVFLYLFFILSDRNPSFAKFLYSDLRSAVISFGVCSIMGMNGIITKNMYDLTAVGFFVSMFAILYIILVAIEQRE